MRDIKPLHKETASSTETIIENPVASEKPW